MHSVEDVFVLGRYNYCIWAILIGYCYFRGPEAFPLL